MKTILGLLICTAYLSCGGPAITDRTVIKGTLKGLDEATLYVSYIDDKGYQNDLVQTKNGRFEWSKPIDFPTRVTFALSQNRRGPTTDAATMWTEPGLLELTLRADDIARYTLKGSSLDLVVRAFEKEIESCMEKIKELEVKLEAMPSKEETAQLMEEYRVVSTQMNEKKLKFVEQHPDSRYSASLLFDVHHHMPPEEVQRWLDVVEGDAANSQYVRRMRQEIKGKIDGMVGSKAPLFSGTDINGKPFDMADLIGEKYIILDFWASWCVPCRRGNPHLKELHDKYRKDGLVVVCSADNDSSVDTWRKAVAEDGLEQFIHILRGWGGMENYFDQKDNSAKYGVQTLPTKFLIGKEGIILGRYGGGGEPHEAMDEKLKDVFGY